MLCSPPIDMRYVSSNIMKTITTKISDEEFLAVSKYADMCGESISNLIYKILIQEITFMKHNPDKMSQQYAYQMLLPEGILNEEKIIEENYNKIRQILNLEKIRLI